MCAGAHIHVYISVMCVCMHQYMCTYVHMHVCGLLMASSMLPTIIFQEDFLKLQHLFQTHRGSGPWQLLCFLHKCPEFNYR